MIKIPVFIILSCVAIILIVAIFELFGICFTC